MSIETMGMGLLFFFLYWHHKLDPAPLSSVIVLSSVTAGATEGCLSWVKPAEQTQAYTHGMSSHHLLATVFVK